ncbi:hypothetical protein NSK_007944 [Nannochloropsis salina CCMP1776]|uniref:RxLR effector protein n=1 Tax=Nannochloropsis salina CCMP1776 TaxID=1027361 RepID=A0A4D9CRS9_9STRA|nr:hypothetical protein NSK_007944 [Nannochloropsis salina CCMP1776]|eukprot:TFJ80767.1 hypothetical protein NSK_007944 [Nannochloropsis salina CCMP1776]
MRVIASLLLLAAVCNAFQAPIVSRGRSRQAPQMLGNFFKTAAPSAAPPGQGKVGAKAGKGGSRLNLKSIPKEAPPAPKKLASIAAGIAPAGPKVPSFPFKLGRTKEAKESTARVVNGKLEGYFTNEQLQALEVARREVPSSAASYWQKIASKVPGQTAETCKAMTNQLLLDKARGTGKNFFGGYVEVKETKMVVDTEATVGKRLKAAFGLK